jgi:hypothetical protein
VAAERRSKATILDREDLNDLCGDGRGRSREGLEFVVSKKPA